MNGLKRKVFVPGTISYMMSAGKRFALYKNYVFTINKKYKDKKVFYRCVEYPKTKCRSCFSIEGDTLKEGDQNHNHSSTVKKFKERYTNAVFQAFPIEVLFSE